MVRELLILAAARVRRQQLADSYPQPARNVRCAGFEWDAERRKWVRCQEFAESGRFGRTLRYHSKPCQRRAKWLRHTARRRGAGVGDKATRTGDLRGSSPVSVCRRG
jgi:hypothetical protein